jgi:hypothetical protein
MHGSMTCAKEWDICFVARSLWEGLLFGGGARAFAEVYCRTVGGLQGYVWITR